MASNTEILIKRSLANTAPTLLNQGELAYSYASNTLFIGTPDSDGALEIGAWSNLSGDIIAGGVEGVTYGNTTNIPSITVDQHGKIIAISNNTISTALTIDADSGGPSTVDLLTQTLTIDSGDGVNTSVSGQTITVEADYTQVIGANGYGGLYQTIDGVLNISGSLNVSGNISYTNVDTFISQNSLIKLANNNITSDVVDIGFFGESNNGTEVVYTGLFRHAGDAGKDYYLFDGYNKADPDADFVIDPTDASFRLSTLHANLISQKVESNVFLANQGFPDESGNAGFSFSGSEGGYDTGMFSPSNGELYLYANQQQVIQANTAGIKLYKPVTLQYGATLHDAASGAIALGRNAGVGSDAKAIAIGLNAGDGQSSKGIAIGYQAAQSGQSSESVAIGNLAGNSSQGLKSVAIGPYAGQTSQHQHSIAIGDQAGNSNQGAGAIAIGVKAGQTNQNENSIVINADYTSGNPLNTTGSGFYVNPIRANNATGGNVTVYNTSTKELVSTDVTINNAGITLANGTTISDSAESGLFVDSLNFGETLNVVFYNIETKEVTYGHLSDVISANAISNGSYIWSVGGTDGHLYSDAGTEIADSATNTLIGQNLDLTNTNTNRVAVGINAGNDNQGNDSVAVGYNAGQTNQSYSSVAVGHNAGYTDQHYFATAVGYNAGYTTQGTNATAIGHAAGEYNQDNHAVAVGFAAGNNYQGFQATAVGRRAGNQYQGDYAVAIGAYAAEKHQDNYTVAIGYYAGNEYQHHGSIAIGDYAGAHHQTTDSIAIGHSAGENYNTSNGWAPISMGRFAGQEYSGSQSVAIGNYAGNNGVGYHAVAVGAYAARNGSGDYAVAIGDSSGDYAGDGAVAIGYESGYQANNYSVAVGYQAGSYDGASGLGDYQIALGYRAAYDHGFNNSIVLNASGSNLSANASGLYVNPIRYTETQDSTYDGLMFYNQSTKEVRYSYTLDGGSF